MILQARVDPHHRRVDLGAALDGCVRRAERRVPVCGEQHFVQRRRQRLVSVLPTAT